MSISIRSGLRRRSGGGSTPMRGTSVLLDRRSGSPLDTHLERNSPPGPRIKHLGAVVRDREWCPDTITNSLCVNRVRVSQLLNTAESLRWLATTLRRAPAVTRRCSQGATTHPPASRVSNRALTAVEREVRSAHSMPGSASHRSPVVTRSQWPLHALLLLAAESAGSTAGSRTKKRSKGLALGQARSLDMPHFGRAPPALVTLWAFETDVRQIPPEPITGCALDQFVPKNCWAPLQNRVRSRVRLILYSRKAA